ncbi:curli production assembly/transport component CsgF [Chromohalobacter marismortui]|uniref:Curli production assembly/transport component CsgF n=1 Tax=Chromohalobacter marismortui TaxID=42055 RepID=A0A4R7NS75_9GAMM|nr:MULTISPECIES: curli assembly protein CsgF [Chromohalobacter]MCI0511296.1 curli assembly protein CsgF [Chromohalobacter sp.]MCI0592256.1 curli assembly protein CsgF [Chromohalobacter sp.]TDU23688.1 curli production assembly/transport component CsgF [Chromohalobacter marismortui]
MMRRVNFRLCLGGVLLATLGVAPGAWAGDLVYQPINPAFGGDPFYINYLLQTADVQNQYKDDGDEYSSLFEEETTADKFADAIRNTMIAGSASQLSEAIFQDGAPPSGNFSLDGAMVSYETVGDRVVVNISDGINTNVVNIPRSSVGQ